MQMFEQALAQELETIPTLGGKVYPLNAPEKAYDKTKPYAIYVSSEGLRTKEIGAGYVAGKSVRAEVNVIAKRYEEVKPIAATVVDLLVSMERRQIGTDGPFIQEMTYRAPVEIYEPAPALYRSVIEFNVYF